MRLWSDYCATPGPDPSSNVSTLCKEAHWTSVFVIFWLMASAIFQTRILYLPRVPPVDKDIAQRQARPSISTFQACLARDFAMPPHKHVFHSSLKCVLGNSCPIPCQHAKNTKALAWFSSSLTDNLSNSRIHVLSSRSKRNSLHLAKNHAMRRCRNFTRLQLLTRSPQVLVGGGGVTEALKFPHASLSQTTSH